jgi:hypothetical protein
MLKLLKLYILASFVSITIGYGQTQKKNQYLSWDLVKL